MARAARGVLVAFALLTFGCVTVTPPDVVTLERLDSVLGQLLLVGFDGTDAADATEIEPLV